MEERLLQLQRSMGNNWVQIAKEIGGGHTPNSVRSKFQRLTEGTADVGVRLKPQIEGNSSISKSFKTEQVFTEEELLLLHNLDPNDFRINKMDRNQWTMTNAEGEQYWNYQSHIVAEPITDSHLSLEAIVEHLQKVKPRSFELRGDVELANYLLIPMADLHFGLNTLSDYEGLLNEILEQIKDGYAEILITLHGDYFHTDNLLGMTEKGTKVDDINLYQAIQDGHDFIASIIEESLKSCPCVKLVYLPGNHSPSNDMIFTMGLKRLYPDLEVDDLPNEYKHSWLGPHSIFMHHGDKIKDPKRLLESVVSEFAKEWGESASRYIITGHFHHEKSLSTAGMTHYQVMSPSKSSGYDKKNGYTTSEHGLMLFEFNDKKRRAIYYL